MELEELEEEYERLLDLLGIEMIEGVGLEGDWDIMTDEQKCEALTRAIAECEERLEEEKVEIELRDAFGKPYLLYALPREKIIKILVKLAIGDIVAKAYGAYCPNLAKGVAQLNAEDGKLIGATYTTGSGDIQGHYIDLYSVEQNLDLSSEDLFSSEEMALCNEKYEGDYSELCKQEGIDLQEREFTALVEYAYDYIRSEDWWREIEEMLNRIFEKEEEESE